MIRDFSALIDMLRNEPVKKGVAVVAIDDLSACVEKVCEMAKAGEIDCIMKRKIETGAIIEGPISYDLAMYLNSAKEAGQAAPYWGVSACAFGLTFGKY